MATAKHTWHCHGLASDLPLARGDVMGCVHCLEMRSKKRCIGQPIQWHILTWATRRQEQTDNSQTSWKQNSREKLSGYKHTNLASSSGSTHALDTSARLSSVLSHPSSLLFPQGCSAKLLLSPLCLPSSTCTEQEQECSPPMSPLPLRKKLTCKLFLATL